MIEDLKAALKKEGAVVPRARARAETIEKAMAAFAAHHGLSARQGTVGDTPGGAHDRAVGQADEPGSDDREQPIAPQSVQQEQTLSELLSIPPDHIDPDWNDRQTSAFDPANEDTPVSSEFAGFDVWDGSGTPDELASLPDETSSVTPSIAYDDELGEYNGLETPEFTEDELRTFAADDLPGFRQRRTRPASLAIAATICATLVIAIPMLSLQSDRGSGPTVVALQEPMKIGPEAAGPSETDRQSKLVYDRVDSGSEIANSQLVVAGNNQVRDIPPMPDDDTSSAAPRLILKGGPAAELRAEEMASTDRQASSNGRATTIASSAAEPAPIGPKQVRTVVVRADGTIVSSEAVTPGENAMSVSGSSRPSLAELPPAIETSPAPRGSENPFPAENFGIEPAGVGVPDLRDSTNEATRSASAPIQSYPDPAALPLAFAYGEGTTRVSVNRSINAPSPAAAPTASAGLDGGFLVQLSSQRSEATALETFTELQRRYPTILGDRAPNIERANLGERGIFYRVRVGYPTREQAVAMCEDLKAAGGDCLLAAR